MDTKICDTCLTAVHAEFRVADLETQESIARDIGAEIDDHCCESVETGEPCGCGCRRTLGTYQSPQGFTGKRMGQPSDGAGTSGSARGGGLSGKGSI